MTHNILSPHAATRRKLLKFGAAASVLPWVHIRSAGASGQLTMFTWDHWVPANNVELQRQIALFSSKTKIEVKLDFVTSQGNQTLLTLNAQALGKTGHDVIWGSNFTMLDQAHLLEPMDDVVGRLEAQSGKANPATTYLARYKGRWIAVPSSWGGMMVGPAGRISILKEAAGLDVVKMYPAGDAAETAEAKAWTWEAFLKAAEACHKVGKPFGLGLGTTSDSVNSTSSILAAYGAEMVDAKGAIQMKSAAMREVLEYAQRLVKFLPADAQSWDDASNNRALISGQSAMIFNPPSAWAVALRDAPAIAADTWHFPTPTGPKGRFVPTNSGFWGMWQFSRNKSAGKELIEFLMQPEHVATRIISSAGYDIPPYQKMTASDTWDKIGPPIGTAYNYPLRRQHNAVESVAHMAASPEVALQIINRGTAPTMFAKLQAGESINQVIDWATRELEGFVRG